MERRKGKWAFGIGLLLGAVPTIWFGILLTSPKPGSVEEAFWRIRVGMSLDQAVSMLKRCPTDSVHYSGVTLTGRRFSNFGFNNIPPPGEIDYGELYVMDDDGNEAEIFYREGGTVSGKRWDPSGSPGERLLIKVRHALDHRLIRKAIGRMACDALGL